MKKENDNTNKTPIFKKWWFWVIIAAGVGVLALILFLVFRGPSFDKTYLTGMKVNEACDTAMANGWEIYAVTNGNNESEHTNCKNSDNEVVAYVYMDHIKKVEIWYDGEKAQETKVEEKVEEEPKAEEKTETKQEATTTTTTTQKTETTSNVTWKQFLNEYESWVNKYVDFMKRYKNASSSDMLGMMSEYTSLMQQQTEWTSKIDGLKSDLSASDLTEYMNAINKINQKLLEAY